MLIEDPKTGHVAEVTHEGFLRVLGVAVPWQTHHSENHESAYASGNGMITMDGTDNAVFFIQNTSQTDKIFVTGMVGSTNDTAGVKFSMYKGGAYTSGGTVGGAVNMNLTSRNVAENTVYYGDDMVVADGTFPIFTGYVAQGMTQFPLGGSLILGYLDTVHVNVLGTNAKNATVGMTYFFHGGRF